MCFLTSVLLVLEDGCPTAQLLWLETGRMGSLERSGIVGTLAYGMHCFGHQVVAIIGQW